MRLLLISWAFCFTNPRCDSSSPPQTHPGNSTLYTPLSSHKELLQFHRGAMFSLVSCLGSMPPMNGVWSMPPVNGGLQWSLAPGIHTLYSPLSWNWTVLVTCFFKKKKVQNLLVMVWDLRRPGSFCFCDPNYHGKGPAILLKRPYGKTTWRSHLESKRSWHFLEKKKSPAQFCPG